MKSKAMPIQKGHEKSNSSTPPPSQKKLKQALLPFQAFKSPQSSSDQNQKKRKLSDSVDDDIKIVKVVRSDDDLTESKKEVISSSPVSRNILKEKIERHGDVICISDSEDSMDMSSPQKSKFSSKNENVNMSAKTNASKSLSISSEIAVNKSKSETAVNKSKTETGVNKSKTETAVNNENSPRISKPTPLKCSKTEMPECKVQCNTSEKITNINAQNSSLSEEKLPLENINAQNSSLSEEKLPRELFCAKEDSACKEANKISSLDSSVSSYLENKVQPSTDTTPSKTISTPNSKKLTPKQLQKLAESEKKKEEKERLKLEKEKKRLEEIEAKQKEKEEKLQLKKKEKEEKEEQKRKEKEEKEEQKRKEKEEKEQQKRKEKEEKEKKKQQEIELKNEEKKAREEEKRKKEEAKLTEKKKREERRLAEEEAKKKEAAAFTSFFVLRKPEPKPAGEIKSIFHPFRVKQDMKLAPIIRARLSEQSCKELEESLDSQTNTILYLEELKNGTRIPSSHKATWPLSDLRDEVIIIEDDDDVKKMTVGNLVLESHANVKAPRPKLLQFHENRRPPYWGTWSKRSKIITARQPYGKEAIFDYENDSDDEWEEEEPGESLHGSDDEKESEDDYEVDDFLVPHGYLSDEENDAEESLSPETMKERLKLLEVEFQQEMKQKTDSFKPRVIGCIWLHPNGTDPTSAVGAQIMKLLESWRAVYQNCPIVTSDPDEDNSRNSDQELVSGSPQSRSKKITFPESDVPDLIRLIHGNINNRMFLVREFIAFWQKKNNISKDSEMEVDVPKENDNSANSPAVPFISKRSVACKIKEIASWIQCPEECPMKGRYCWYVPSEIRSQFNVLDIQLPNESWVYVGKPRRKEPASPVACETSGDQTLKSLKPLPLITKFTKKVTREELLTQMKEKNIPSKLQKRVLLTKLSDSEKSRGPLNKRKGSNKMRTPKHLPTGHMKITSLMAKHDSSKASIITVKNSTSTDGKVSSIAVKHTPSVHKEATLIATKKKPGIDLNRFKRCTEVSSNSNSDNSSEKNENVVLGPNNETQLSECIVID